jgi:hypothetical protein
VEPKDQFFGVRSGSLTGPFGHKRTKATHMVKIIFSTPFRGCKCRNGLRV